MSDLPVWALEQGRSLCWGAGAEAIARALVAERAAERERCAKIAEDSAPVTQDGFGDYGSELCDGIAAAIRNQEPER